MDEQDLKNFFKMEAVFPVIMIIYMIGALKNNLVIVGCMALLLIASIIVKYYYVAKLAWK